MNTSENQSDLLIIGGGVLGVFHAFHALKRGLRVTLLERNNAPRGATVRNFGQVVPSGMDQVWQVFGRESLAIYRELQSQFDISVREQGSIYLASDDEELTLLEELAVINADASYPSRLLTARQCRDRFPVLRADYCRGGLFFPEEVSVNPRQMIHRLHQWLAGQTGFTSHFQSHVGELSTANGRVVATTTDGRQFPAEQAIVCSGNDFQTLFPTLFRKSDLQTVKLQMLRLKPHVDVSLPGNILTGESIRRYESFSQCPSWAKIKAHEPADSFGKQWGVHILFKQEADGGIILGDSHEYAPASQTDQLDFDIRQDISDYFINQGKAIFDLPNWEIETAWYGLYCQTKHPDGVFRQTIDNQIHITTGIGGKGMTSSAGFARHNLEQICNA